MKVGIQCGAHMYTHVYCNMVADIDECSGEKLCDHNCTNQNGSYLCSCKHGFVLLDDQRSCEGMAAEHCC